jgi:hypothetical protein
MQADQANIRCKLFHALSGLPLTARQHNCGSGVQTSFQRDGAFLYVAVDRADMSIILTLSSSLASFKNAMFRKTDQFHSIGEKFSSQVGLLEIASL